VVCSSFSAPFVDAVPGDGLCASTPVNAPCGQPSRRPTPFLVRHRLATRRWVCSFDRGTGKRRRQDLDILGEVNIVGQGMTLTGIVANGLNDRVFHVHAGVTSFVLDGVTVFGVNAGTQNGGALLNESDNALIFESSFQYAVAQDGGAVMNTRVLGSRNLFSLRTRRRGSAIRNEARCSSTEHAGE
jgi:hypothetical protein